MTRVITIPNAVLRQVAKPIAALDKRVLNIVKNMEKTLLAAKNPQGVGLAASQIGVPLRIFLTRPVKNGPITVFINPEITHYSQRTTHPTTKKGVYEGCLSIPNHYAPIRRSTSVTVKYQIPKLLSTMNYELITKTAVFSGFPAHVIQHEMDHLNGILFIDRVLEQNIKLYKTAGKDWVEVGI